MASCNGELGGYRWLHGVILLRGDGWISVWHVGGCVPLLCRDVSIATMCGFVQLHNNIFVLKDVIVYDY